MKLRRSGLLLCSLSLFGMLSSHSHPSILNQRRHGAMIVNPNYPSLTKTFEFRWEDKDGNTYPLVGAKVEWSYKQLDFTYTTYTDEFGYITINFLNQALKSHFTLNKLSLENDNISIKHFDNNIIDKPSSVYTMDISSFNNSSTIVINPNGSNSYSEDFGKATHIFESLYYYSQYTRSILPNGETLEHCDAYYPCQSKINADTHELDDILNAYYQYNGIYLPAENFNNNLGVYESWDTIGHEYGHHLGETLNILPAFYSGSHNSKLDDISQLLQNDTSAYDNIDYGFYTEKGLGLAWSEAWPTYWANEAQFHFPSNLKETYAMIPNYIRIPMYEFPSGNEIPPSERISSLADDYYEAYNSEYSNFYSIASTNYNDNSIFPTLNPPIDFTQIFVDENSVGGEACERSLMNFLWQLNRSLNTTSSKYDHVWDILFSMRDYYNNYEDTSVLNFSMFYNYLNVLIEQNYNQDYTIYIKKEKLYEILDHSCISANNIIISQDSQSFNIKWTINGNYEKLPIFKNDYPRAYTNGNYENRIKLASLRFCIDGLDVGLLDLSTLNFYSDSFDITAELYNLSVEASDKYAKFNVSIPLGLMECVIDRINSYYGRKKSVYLDVSPHEYTIDGRNFFDTGAYSKILLSTYGDIQISDLNKLIK